MSKRALFPLLLLLSLLTAGCQVFPYVLTTAEAEVLPTATQTHVPTETLAFTATLAEPTATELPPTGTPTSAPTETPEPVFFPQEGSPIYMANFAHPTTGCGWSGVGGQVFAADGVPLAGLFVIGGDDSGQRWAAQTGLSPAYGPGGYEIQLSDQATDTTGFFWIQVLDEAGQPVSDRIYFDIFQDCERNLVLINFGTDWTYVEPHSASTPKPTPTLEAYP